MAGAVGALGAAHTERRRLTFLTIPQAREVLATTDESSLLGRKVSALTLALSNSNPNP